VRIGALLYDLSVNSVCDDTMQRNAGDFWGNQSVRELLRMDNVDILT
jgi:hypothetical protein